VFAISSGYDAVHCDMVTYKMTIDQLNLTHGTTNRKK